MLFIYNIFIALYNLAIRIASLFNEKARLFVAGRKNWEEKLAAKILPGDRYVWFHCASLGEFEQGRPVMESLRKRYPDFKLALTFFSPSGYEIRKNYPGADLVAYLPVDTVKNAKAFLDILKPEKAIFVKYEYWRNIIFETHRRDIPLYVFSAIFRTEQPFFRQGLIGKWFRGILFCFDYIFVQNNDSAVLLEKCGIKNVIVSGDTRFDRVFDIASTAREIPLAATFKDNKHLVVAGSTWKPDEELLIEYINRHPKTKFIVAPHEVSESNMNRIESLLKCPSIRFSKAGYENINHFQVLIIDSIGLLSSLYQYGEMAYIGGGFGVGIHNILEAATFGLPVVFGPNYHKFKEARDLIALGGAFSIASFADVERVFSMLSEGMDLRIKSSVICSEYVKGNIGSTFIILDKIFE